MLWKWRIFEYTGEDCRVPKDVVSVRFHPSVAKVQNGDAFKGRTSLREVIFNEGLQEIENLVFHYCESLQSVTLPSSLIEIGRYAFSRCTSLKEVILNEGLQKIGACAFSSCEALESVNLPSTVDEIGSSVFNGCGSLRKVVLNKELKRIKANAFNRCTSLTSITIPPAVTEIEQYAFNYCTNLREVVIHNEEVQIDQRAFHLCSSLERFSFPSLSTRLNYIVQAGHRGIETKLDDISEVEWRGGELSIPAIRRRVLVNPVRRVEMNVVEVDREKLDKVDVLILYYEFKEATTLFELALWKAKIDQTDDTHPTNREACCIEVPGPVKDTILQYLS